jgi:hypothetical protein
MSLDLNKLENKLDEALSNETSETLTKFLNDKRMTNNKQQTAVEWLWEIAYNRELTVEDWKQAKEMEKEQSHLYAAFCIKCIHEKMPIIKFEDWTKLGGGNK